MSATRPVRVLFIFAWLVVGGEETEVRLLAEHLDPQRYQVDVVACLKVDGMPDLSHRALENLGVRVDTTPYTLSLEDTIDHLVSVIPAYDVVVICQNPPDAYGALQRLAVRPAVVEHGGLVSEAEGPKHLTDRYVGVCDEIRDAAAARMPGRPEHALVIPSMVDLSAYPRDEADRDRHREAVREELRLPADAPIVGWVGRLDRKKNVGTVVEAFCLAAAERPEAHLLIIGGPDAFMPEYAEEIAAQVKASGMSDRIHLLGDRSDVPALLSGTDALVWLSRGEGMPHVIAEAGAARLPVVATADNGVRQQLVDEESGLLVPYDDPTATAAALGRLLDDPGLRQRLGRALRRTVEDRFSTDAVIPQWQQLFDELVADRTPAPPPTLFRSWVQGGFESSTHRRRGDNLRLDMIAGTHHDSRVAEDYRMLAGCGIRTVRDGARWHLVESRPGSYDMSSLQRQVEAAATTGTQVIWDLLHYGWPDDLDPWGTSFVGRFTDFAVAVASYVAQHTPGPHWFTPVNEPSFLSWGGGDVAYMNPFGHGRGTELKVQLARAAISVSRALKEVVPGVRLMHPDPLIHVVADDPQANREALTGRTAQFHAWDMIAGLAWPQLGGSPDLLDVVGVNYYFNNQWIHEGKTLTPEDSEYVPLSDLLAEVYGRYGRPVLIAETGIEDDRRAPWLREVGRQVQLARARGVPVEGICLYPVLGHVGWDDDRYCPNGLLELEPDGSRTWHDPLLEEVRRLTATEPGAYGRDAARA